MAIDTFVDIHPKRIRTLAEVDDALSKIREYEKQMNCRGGIVLKQNRQLGGSYRIVSEEEAINGINNPGTCEWYVKFYARSYFEELRERLNGDREKDYS